VGANDLEVELLGQFEQARHNLTLRGQSMVLDFDEKILPAVDVDKAAGRFPGVVVTSVKQALWDEGDQALRIPGERFEIRAGPVVKTLEMGVGNEFQQILVTGMVAGQQSHVED